MIYRSKYRHNLTDIVVQQLHLILHDIYIFSNLTYFLYIRQHIYDSSKQISILKTCNSQEKRKSFRIFQLKLLFVKINQTTQGQIYSLYIWCVCSKYYTIFGIVPDIVRIILISYILHCYLHPCHSIRSYLTSFPPALRPCSF